MNIVVAILIFSVIVVIHELGHFFLAKANGVEVTEFSVGMGPRLITLVKTEHGFSLKFLASTAYLEGREDFEHITKYSIKLLPFGGSCMMLGEEDMEENEDTKDENSFQNKSVYARMSIIFAGPLFNFILAFILAIIVVACVGVDRPVVSGVSDNMPMASAGISPGDDIVSINNSSVTINREVSAYFQFNRLGEQTVDMECKDDGKAKDVTVMPVTKAYRLGFTYGMDKNGEFGSASIMDLEKDSPAEQAGIKRFDVITKINDHQITSADDVSSYFRDNPASDLTVKMTVTRDGKSMDFSITPKLMEYGDGGYKLGFTYGTAREKVSGLQVIKYSAVEVKFWIVTTIKSVGQLITGKVSKDEISGPIGIVTYVDDVIQESSPLGIKYVILNILNISILLTANLGVMNLLPIPALDGGRLLFLIIEWIRRKPLNRKWEGMINVVGFMALMVLMVFVMFNDIIKLF